MVMRAERCRVAVTYASGFPIRLSCRGKNMNSWSFSMPVALTAFPGRGIGAVAVGLVCEP